MICTVGTRQNRTALAVIWLSFPAAASAQFTIAPGSPFLTGAERPNSTAVADFNGDGKVDLAVSNYGSNNITVLLGNGAGGFTAAPGSPFAVGSVPFGLVTGDFNGDGKPDLAVSNESDDNVTVLLGDGAGGFAPAPGSPFDVGLVPIGLAIADFNGDGVPDLAVVNLRGNDVFILLGNGLGGFSPVSGIFQVGSTPVCIRARDFNGDGKADLVTANEGDNNLTVLLGDGSGGFTAAPGSPFAVGSTPNGVAVADLNGDGKLDLAVSNLGSNNVTILLGNGSGGFAPPAISNYATGNNPNSPVVADFNGDGNPDLAVDNLSDGTVSVLLGNGSGGFNAAAGSPFAAIANPAGAVVADFNGDGKPDIAVTGDSIDGSVMVLLNNFPGGAPAIKQGGVVAADSTVTSIQPGEWVSIYGAYLASSTAIWTGDFPTLLGGTSVTINGNAAYLSYVSPTQINLQAPNDITTGPVPVVVTAGTETATSTVTLAPFAPSFLLFDNKHVTGIIVRSDGSGAYGGGAYDFLGPTGNSLGFQTVAAKAGDTVELYAGGLGPTTPPVPAGQAYSGNGAATTNKVTLHIGGMSVLPSFAGFSTSLLYQINLTIPAGLGTGDVPLAASVGGFQTQPGVVISLQ
jgi:uncharacterized protein (TIGR03437 family)